MGLGTITAEIDSAYAWWRTAGVEEWTGESPAIWFDEPKPARTAKLRADAVREDAAPPPMALPETLEALTDWLMTSDVFAAVGARRLAPAGPVGETMIVVDMPELADLEAGRLFAGALEAQVDAVLKAVGLSRDTAYFVTMLPGRTPDGRIPPALLATAVDAVRRHVALAQPTKIWAMGDAAAQALFGTRVNQKRRELLAFETIPGIATIHPRLLLDDPDRERRKAMWPLMQLLFPKDEA